MKKSVKKMQLKKRSISVLNANAVKGGIIPIPFLVSIFCKTKIYVGEDICFTEQQQ